MAVLEEDAKVAPGHVGSGVAREPLAVSSRETLVGGDPKLALAVHQKLPGVVAREAVAHGVGLECLAVEAADSTRLDGEPEGPVAVLGDVPDVSRADGLRRLDGPDLVAVVAKEAADGAEEDRPGAALVDGEHGGREALDFAEASEMAAFVDGEAEPAPDPEAPLPVLHERGDPAVGKLGGVARVEDVEAGAVEAGETGLGAEPEEVVAGLADGVDRVLGQAVVGGPEPGRVLGDRPLGLIGQSGAGDEKGHEESGRRECRASGRQRMGLGEIGQTD